ncbi:hypothetical protein AX15_006957 [Amanita polypyramis BW_CC]|nr:hypothetical protein AX15_006957 [Amanita polypyramis BW_CC]
MPDDNVFAGRVTVKQISTKQLFACKVAWGQKAVEKLSNEYQAYLLLSEHVPCLRVYGLFRSEDGNAVMIMQYIDHPADHIHWQGCRNEYEKLLGKIHDKGLVLDRLTENSLLCTGHGFSYLVSLSGLRKAKNKEDLEHEKEALQALFARPNQRSRISYGVSIGPFAAIHDFGGLSECSKPEEKFEFVVTQMRIEAPETVRISDGQVPYMIDVEFGDKKASDRFFTEWCKARKPPGFEKLGCVKM